MNESPDYLLPFIKMEAVPRMFMLSLELKWSLEKVEFGPNIKQYIQRHYMEEPNKYNDEIKQLDQLRVNASNVTRDFNGISTLKKYYGQLHLLTSRFPITDGGEAAPVFTWIDTFHEEPFSHADASFDQACILYNLGVLHSILGAKESRASEEEMKVACTHFQCAAGAFSYLKDHFQSYMSPDISFDLMAIYISLMLGQAQECLLEKSMQDNRKSSLVSRISMQVIEYYRLALRGLEDSNISSLMGSRRSKTWKKTVQVKISHFLSVAYMYMSNQADEQQKHGERVCWLQQSVDRHNEAMKLSKGVNDGIIQALNFTKDVVLGKFQAAKKDNDFVYHDAIPAFESLPEIKGASLVKALTFQPYDESIAGPDIFKKLVPMEAHEASSLYSEEKAKVLRRVGDEIEQKTKHLDQFMASLQLDQLKLDTAEEPERLPQVMLEVCAALSVKTEPIKQLVSSMQELSNVVLDVDADVKELQEILDAEGNQEADFQKECGKRPTKIISEIQQEFCKYKEGHDKASKSNQELHKAMQVHIKNIRKLAGPLDELHASLPSIKDLQSSADKDAESKLSMLIKKVDEMKTQRTSLETQLRDQLRSDDITSRIVTTEGGNMKELFEDELKKHNTLTTYIEQNLAAQDNILKALTEANAAYADTRKMQSEVAKKRDDKIQELIASYTVYDDLLAKSHKGIEFYKKLQLGMNKLLTRTNEVIKFNQEEREVTVARLKPKPAQARPTAPKPVLPVEPVPAGPKLSDFWQPKSSKQPPLAGVGGVGSVPMLPASVSGQYPDSLHHGGGPANVIPPGFQGLARHSSFDSAPVPTSLGSHSHPSQGPAFVQPGVSSGSPSRNVPQPSNMPHDQNRMPPFASSAPMSQPSSAPVSLQSQPHSTGQIGTSQPGIQAQHPQPTAPHPVGLSYSQTPMMSQSGSQQPAISYGQQPMVPGSRPQMQQPMVPQPFSQSQTPHLQQQLGYPTTSSQPSHSHPRHSVPDMASNAHLPQVNPPAHGIQAQPHTSTAIVSSVTTPIASAMTQPLTVSQSSVAGHQPSGPQHQQVPPRGTTQQFRGVAPVHPGSQIQHQPSNANAQQPNLPPQVSQPQLAYQNVMQHPQQPMVLQPAGQSQYPISSHQMSQSQPQQSTSQPVSYQQQQPDMQATHPAGFQQQQLHQHQQSISQVNQTPALSPQHRPQQNYSQPGPTIQPGLQQVGQPQQQQHMQPNQTPTASPQHIRPAQQVQGMTQTGPGLHQGFGQSMPQQQQQQQHQPQHQLQQQHQPQQQQQQPSFNQARFSAPSTQQGSPVRQAPQVIPPGSRQQMHPSQVQGQQTFPPLQPAPGPGGIVQFQQNMQVPQQPGGIKPGIVGQPASVGQQSANMGQPAGFTGHPPASTGQQSVSIGQPASSGQQAISIGQPPGSMGQPPHSGQPSQGQFHQAGGQIWSSGGQLPQQPTSSHQQPMQQTGQAQPIHQSFTQQPQSQETGQFTSSQHSMGYANQQPQGFRQTNQTPPPPAVNQSGQRMPPAGNSLPHVANPPNQRMQTPIVNPPQHPGMNQSFKCIPPSGALPSHQGVPKQQPYNPMIPYPAGTPNQPYQQSSQPPLNQVQQVNKALKEEQQRLPQPSLQPVKVEPSSRDLLSNSPDSEQISLGKPLIPQTQTLETPPDAPPMTQTETPAPMGTSPPIQSYSSNEDALSDVFKQSGPSSLSSQPPESSDTQASPRPILPAPTVSLSTSEGQSAAAAHPFPKSKDPYDDKQTLDKFVEEVERFEKYVDGLGKKMLIGPTVLDGLWKELVEAQDRDTRQYSIAVARCYSIKNRHPDVMPYDHNRVELQTGKDDYINASSINDLSPASPRFIATQAPSPSTYNDFWLMVYEQQISLIAMLVSQSPMAKSKADFDQYWPEDRGQVKTYGSILISLQSKRSTDYQIDRTFHLIHKDTKQERTVFQLQFTAWPECGVPSRPADLLQYVSDVNSYYMQQRSMSTPIVVHCNSGVGRTGTFCLIYSAVREMMCGGGIVDIPREVKTLRQQRRGMVAEKEQLKFTYLAVLCFAQQVLAKRGISAKSLVSSPQVDLKHLQRITSFDVIMGADSVTSLHSRISKMSVRISSQESMPASEATGSAFQGDVANPGSLSPGSDDVPTNQEAALPTKSDTDTPTEVPLEPEADETSIADSSDSAQALQAPPSLVEFTESNLTDFSLNPSQFIPDVVESSQQEGGDPVQGSENPGDGPLPSILADLTPQNFSIKGNSKQRISKADFTGQKSALGSTQSGDDPLSSLDPLWTMKTKGETNTP